MITKVGMHNISLNFGKKPAEKTAKEAQMQNVQDYDTMTALETRAKILAAEAFATRAIKEREEDELFEKIRVAAQSTIDEVNRLYEEGNIIREDGSSVKIIDTNDGKQSMYENSRDVVTTRKSYFKDGKLHEIRIPMKSQNGIPREIIIKTYKDGKTLEDYEFKTGKPGEGTIDTLITYTKEGDVVAYMGNVDRIQTQSALYINL